MTDRPDSKELDRIANEDAIAFERDNPELFALQHKVLAFLFDLIGRGDYEVIKRAFVQCGFEVSDDFNETDAFSQFQALVFSEDDSGNKQGQLEKLLKALINENPRFNVLVNTVEQKLQAKFGNYFQGNLIEQIAIEMVGIAEASREKHLAQVMATLEQKFMRVSQEIIKINNELDNIVRWLTDNLATLALQEETRALLNLVIDTHPSYVRQMEREHNTASLQLILEQYRKLKEDLSTLADADKKSLPSVQFQDFSDLPQRLEAFLQEHKYLIKTPDEQLKRIKKVLTQAQQLIPKLTLDYAIKQELQEKIAVRLGIIRTLQDKNFHR